MIKRHKGKLALAAVILLVFLFPFPAFDLAWPYGGEPETVRVSHTENFLTIDVALSPADSAAFLEKLHGCRARFISPGSQHSFNAESYRIELSHPKTGQCEVSFDGHGTLSQQEPQLWRGRSTFRMYPKSAAAFLQTCRDWAGSDSKYPGLAFLQEFFAVGKDGRSDAVFLDAPDGVYGVAAIETIYSGIEPYMTEHGFEKVLLERSLYNLEYLCRQKGEGWRCGTIEVSPASGQDCFFYRASLVREEPGNSENYWFSGSYSVSEDGLVDQFHIDLKGAI